MAKRITVMLVVTLILIMIIAITVIKTRQQTESPTNSLPAPVAQIKDVWKGFSLSPQSYSSNHFNGFWDITGNKGLIVSWTGAITELKNPGNPAITLLELSKSRKTIPVIIAGVTTNSNTKYIPGLNGAERDYAAIFSEMIKKYNLKYIGIGIEINIFLENSPKEYNDYLDFYRKVYALVKNEHPEVKIFSTFQLERMKGLHGGFFGGTNDPAKNSQWNMLNNVPNDMLVLSTYPYLVYDDLASIPKDYYSSIPQSIPEKYKLLPISFSEVGWPRVTTLTFASSEEDQVNFIKYFNNNLLKNSELYEFAIWSFLFDPVTKQKLFQYAGVLPPDETTSSAFEFWIR